MLQQRARTFTVYGFILGLCGFAGLAAMLALHALPARGQLAEAGVLILLGAISWLLSFSILSRARFSLDLTYMITALLLYPSPLPVLVGAGTAILGSFLRPGGDVGGPAGFVRRLASLMVNSGTLIGMMFAGQAAVGLLGAAPAEAASLREGFSSRLVLEVSTLFLVLAAVNVTLMGLSVLLRGERFGPYLRHHARHVLPLEAFNVPLAILMIVTRGSVGFAGLLLLAGLILGASLLLRSLNATQEVLSRANEELKMRSEELSALDRIGREIISNLDLDRVFETIHQQVARLLEAPFFSVVLYNKDRGELRHAFLVGAGRREEDVCFPLGRGAISWAIKSGRPLHLADLPREAANHPFDDSEIPSSLHSVLAIPLRQADGEVMGAMMAGSPRPGAWTARQESMLTSIALHAAIAIENARYYEMATVDQGTRLFLKDYFQQRVQEELARARRYGRPFTILMMDLDGFKQINDQFGHPAGDRLLRQVGEVIKANLRSIDIPCRFGGEEFAALLPETEHSEAVVIAERIRRHVAEIRLREEGRRFGTTISIGLASYPRSARRGAEEVIKKADLALYQAKREGKDKVVASA